MFKFVIFQTGGYEDNTKQLSNQMFLAMINDIG